jgi:hypothetical protein
MSVLNGNGSCCPLGIFSMNLRDISGPIEEPHQLSTDDLDLNLKLNFDFQDVNLLGVATLHCHSQS